MGQGKLTDRECRNLRSEGDRVTKAFDGGGLHLRVSPSGHKSWRMKYRFDGKEKQLTFGPYPLISLGEARARRDEAKRELLAGVDPAKAAREARGRRLAERTNLKTAALRWHTLQLNRWKTHHALDVLSALEKDVFPVIGDLPIADISVQDIRQVLDRMQNRGAVDQAHRMHGRLVHIFDLAIVDELIAHNPARPLKVVMQPVRKRKFKAILRIEDARAALAAWEAEEHLPQVKLASRLLALAAPRPGPLRFASKEEFHDLDGPEARWTIPAAKMKLERAESEQEAFAFTIPLSRQAAAVAKLAIAHAGDRPWVFPAQYKPRNPMSENALSSAYRASPAFAGRHVPHGWRSTFSTIMNERAADLERAGDREIIDLMLGHKPEGVEATYNRAAYMNRRRQIAQEWADLLSEGLAPPEQLLT